MIQIRTATEEDKNAVWEIFSAVIQTADTYVFSPNTPREELDKHWFANYMHTYVAVLDNQIVGTYILKPNQLGQGSHIANASYMVHPSFHGRGIGNSLCDNSIKLAKKLNFLAIQFNIVVSTNLGAISLWKKNGFRTIGTTPKGFLHPTKGYIDTLIMYREL